VTLTDRLPARTRFLKASVTDGRRSKAKAGTHGATVTCHLGTISSGSSRTARIRLKIAAAPVHPVITDTANARSDTPDPSTNNNTATAHTKITE
jgi:hypothetical protein